MLTRDWHYQMARRLLRARREGRAVLSVCWINNLPSCLLLARKQRVAFEVGGRRKPRMVGDHLRLGRTWIGLDKRGAGGRGQWVAHGRGSGPAIDMLRARSLYLSLQSAGRTGWRRPIERQTRRWASPRAEWGRGGGRLELGGSKGNKMTPSVNSKRGVALQQSAGRSLLCAASARSISRCLIVTLPLISLTLSLSLSHSAPAKRGHKRGEPATWSRETESRVLKVECWRWPRRHANHQPLPPESSLSGALPTFGQF